MTRAVVLVLCALIAAQDGGRAAAGLAARDSGRGTHATGVLWILRRSEDDSAAGGAGLCSSLREDDEQLLCADRRSKFNYNPFGLRFGKRAPPPRGAHRARAMKLPLMSLFQEVPT
ncbi:kisspeptin precursor [Oryzias latipes]|uniref:12-RF amide peptide n=1 Tax=Oryzias latipes TaxID=8090 RepID=B6F0X0_ORYLA|nr:kisspeptin 2 precursor [Oryzias latipes]BAG80688.1 12-RF amide peptide [Oryzias latipes]BAG86623.1 kisspeptin [Oryzias latipes]